MTMAYENTVRRSVAAGVRRGAVLLRAVSRNTRRFLPSRSCNPSLTVGESGQALIESAITFPVLFTLLFCFVELCLVFYTHNMISESAREGTQYAMTRSSGCMTSNSGTSTSCAASSAQVDTYGSNLGWPNPAGGTMTPVTTYITVSPNPAGNVLGNYVVVTVSYVFPITIPFVPKNSLTLTSSSQMFIIQ